MKLSMATSSLTSYLEAGVDRRDTLRALRDCGFTCVDFEVTEDMLGDNLVQCAALELAPYGVRVNAFAPGDIANEKHFNAVRDEAILRGISYEEMDEIVKNAIPMRKRLDPAKMGGIILFLSSKDADHITATNLNVSGGSEFR